jgi:CHAD domain-containing protein
MAAGASASLRAELRWLGQVIAPARDAEVLRQRLDGLVDEQPAELVLGPVTSRIDKDLAKAHHAGTEVAKEAMSSERYYRLLDLLDDLLQSPHWSDLAGKRAGKGLPPLLEKRARAVRRAARRARGAEGADRDAALHAVRKKAKRLRYAAESAQEALGPGAAKLARRAKRVQSALGDHHDAVVARAALRQWGIEAHLEGDNPFTFGLLYGLEQERGRAAERSFDSAVAGLGSKHVKRRLRH